MHQMSALAAGPLRCDAGLMMIATIASSMHCIELAKRA